MDAASGVDRVAAIAEDSNPRPHAVAAKAARLDARELQALDIAMQKQVDDKHVSGVIAMIARGEKIGYLEAFGQRDIGNNAPMTNAIRRTTAHQRPYQGFGRSVTAGVLHAAPNRYMPSPNGMSSTTIWHNPRCSKSRQTLQLSRERGIELFE